MIFMASRGLDVKHRNTCLIFIAGFELVPDHKEHGCEAENLKALHSEPV
jgi:hypothetical protein